MQHPTASSDILSACYSPHTELSILSKPIVSARSHQLFKTMSPADRTSCLERGGPALSEDRGAASRRHRPMSNLDDLYADVSAFRTEKSRRSREKKKRRRIARWNLSFRVVGNVQLISRRSHGASTVNDTASREMITGCPRREISTYAVRIHTKRAF